MRERTTWRSRILFLFMLSYFCQARRLHAMGKHPDQTLPTAPEPVSHTPAYNDPYHPSTVESSPPADPSRNSNSLPAADSTQIPNTYHPNTAPDPQPTPGVLGTPGATGTSGSP